MYIQGELCKVKLTSALRLCKFCHYSLVFIIDEYSDTELLKSIKSIANFIVIDGF